LSKDALALDPCVETDKICSYLRSALTHSLKRRGLVVGISGGIDSSVTVALCAKALGPSGCLPFKCLNASQQMTRYA